MIETITLFKTADREGFIEALEEAVRRERGVSILWDPEPNQAYDRSRFQLSFVATTSVVTSLLIDEQSARIVSSVARELECPRISLFLQQHSFWEFVLRVGDVRRVAFSVASENWDQDRSGWAVGGPADLAEVWGIPVENIDKYMVSWQPIEVWVPELQVMSGRYRLMGQKAYPSDEYGYGQQGQAFDFLRALGGKEPGEGRRFLIPLR